MDEIGAGTGTEAALERKYSLMLGFRGKKKKKVKCKGKNPDRNNKITAHFSGLDGESVMANQTHVLSSVRFGHMTFKGLIRIPLHEPSVEFNLPRAFCFLFHTLNLLQ